LLADFFVNFGFNAILSTPESIAQRLFNADCAASYAARFAGGILSRILKLFDFAVFERLICRTGCFSRRLFRRYVGF
jgi:hypothetical protein